MLPALIIMVAAFLRFWDFTSLPFMHDEFSAIFRAQTSSFKELLEKGVLPDAHPPGVQTLLFFLIKYFGVSEPVLKFPFLLMGVGSVIFVYLIAKKWFGYASAVLSAALIAVLQYNIFYSQIIRPYETGLFFSLGSVYFWTKVVFDEKVTLKSWIWFVIFVAANGYMHAFTVFLDILMGITGLFFIKKERRNKYVGAGIVAFLLFLPGFIIFWQQLKRGDIGGWLGKPDFGFLLKYFEYIFHYSGFFASVVLLTAVYLSRKSFNGDKKSVKFRWIAAGWFLATFFTAFLYSLLRTPVIQFSTLYFVFPFFVMLLFSFVGKTNIRLLILAVSVIIFSGLTTLVLDRKHYNLMYHQGFDEIPALVIKDLEKSEINSTAVILQAPETKMFDYYFEKYGSRPDYFGLERACDIPAALNYVKSKNPEQIIIGLADYAPFTFLEVMKNYFPYVEKRKTSQNMEYWLLSKKNNNFPKASGMEKILALDSSFVMSENEQYKGGFTILPDTLKFTDLTILNVNVDVKKDTVIPDVLLVMDWKTSDNKTYFWASSGFKDFYPGGDSTYIVTFSARLGDLKNFPESSKIKIYLWKRDKTAVNIKSMKLYFTTADVVELGLFKSLRK